jgi:hypothetical protein
LLLFLFYKIDNRKRLKDVSRTSGTLLVMVRLVNPALDYVHLMDWSHLGKPNRTRDLVAPNGPVRVQKFILGSQSACAEFAWSQVTCQGGAWLHIGVGYRR